MQKPGFDPGLTQQFTSPFRRIINKDGNFNVRREGGSWRDIHPYLFLINMGWPSFMVTIFCTYMAANFLFAAIYFALGPGQLQGVDGASDVTRFWSGFFFSAHTLSTVGYGNISPRTTSANVVSSFESLIGVLGFAVATGLLFGRVSRPTSRLGFSDKIVIAPYQEGTSLQFRVVNRRSNNLMELEARVLLMTVEPQGSTHVRRYHMLNLERPQIIFLPLTWTIVHPIDSESPLYGKTADDLADLQAEILILIKAYDDTFSQTVFSRYSYSHNEFLWNARFTPAFHVDPEGDMVLEIAKLGEVA